MRPGVRTDAVAAGGDLAQNLRIVGGVLADDEERRAHAFVGQRLDHAAVVFSHGPSSKVRTTSLSRRKSCCLKCSKPKPGPPVVSISTVRATPSAPGLSQFAAAAARRRRREPGAAAASAAAGWPDRCGRRAAGACGGRSVERAGGRAAGALAARRRRRHRRETDASRLGAELCASGGRSRCRGRCRRAAIGAGVSVRRRYQRGARAQEPEQSAAARSGRRPVRRTSRDADIANANAAALRIMTLQCSRMNSPEMSLAQEHDRLFADATSLNECGDPNRASRAKLISTGDKDQNNAHGRLLRGAEMLRSS